MPAVPATGAVSYTDNEVFPLIVGNRFFYRISTLDDTGDESDLSPEAVITITDFEVTHLLTTSGGVGDTVEIEGERFGIYDPAGDKVFFRGMEFQPGIGFVFGLIEASVTDWQLTRITCTVPLGATRGQVNVQSNGLNQDTPEVFTNTDPHIESITPPLSGFSTDVVTVTGRNFGVGPGLSNRLFFGNSALPDASYVSYSDTDIQFRPPIDRGFNTPLDVTVRVGTKISNSGQWTLTNRAPQPSLTATPPDGLSPLVVELDASASVEPDGDYMLFAWDFDGDGTTEFDSGFDPTVSHTYDIAGDYTPTVYVTDSVSSTATDTANLHVSLSRLSLEDNGTFAPGTEFFQPSLTVPISFNLTGGQPEYAIDWYLVDALDGTQFLLANDTGVAYGSGIRIFPIDTTAVAEDGTGVIPAGQWRILAQAGDGSSGNDPDLTFSWPNFANGSPGSFFVYRYDTLVVIDAEGDPTGNEAALVSGALISMGYKVTNRPSSTLSINDMLGRHAVVWTADGPYGKEAFQWLSPADLSLSKGYLNSPQGGALVILGPPASNGELAFTQDADFHDNYQSLDKVFQAADPGVLTVTDFSGGDPVGYPVQRMTMNEMFGGADTVTPPANATHVIQMNFSGPTGTPLIAADFTKSNSGQWNTYVGMFSMSAISGILPSETTPPQLLDNIVANTADRF
ncbi:MAG: PKD domain-containing protein [bacterium]|nr:PKD domain-containing protein [bacterium]